MTLKSVLHSGTFTKFPALITTNHHRHLQSIAVEESVKGDLRRSYWAVSERNGPLPLNKFVVVKSGWTDKKRLEKVEVAWLNLFRN